MKVKQAIESGVFVPQAKNKQLLCHIEEDFYMLAQRVAAKRGLSTSGYIRKLIIDDLSASGLLTTESISRVVAG